MAVLTAPTAALPTASAGESQSRRRSSRAAAPAGAAVPGRMALHTQASRGASTVFARRAAPAAARRSVAMHVSADATAQVKIGTRGRRARAPALPDTHRRPPTTSAARGGRGARRSKPDIRSNPGPGSSLLLPALPAGAPPHRPARTSRRRAALLFRAQRGSCAHRARSWPHPPSVRAAWRTRARARADLCTPSLRARTRCHPPRRRAAGPMSPLPPRR
jgi:hypothetical protein